MRTDSDFLLSLFSLAHISTNIRMTCKNEYYINAHFGKLRKLFHKKLFYVIFLFLHVFNFFIDIFELALFVKLQNELIALLDEGLEVEFFCGFFGGRRRAMSGICQIPVIALPMARHSLATK